MREFLTRSLRGINQNKLRGILAEVAFRAHLKNIGFEDRVSAGGWIARNDARGGRRFAEHACVFFPETIQPGMDYSIHRPLPPPPPGLHSICTTFRQIGVRSYFCAATIHDATRISESMVEWSCIELGLPAEQNYARFPESLKEFQPRNKRHNYLRHATDSATIPDEYVPEEFSKECLRVAFSSRYLSEIVDLDGVFWGKCHAYPIEIKEKAVAYDDLVGEFFGLDVGPFVKLTYYAAKRGNLHSMFVVREVSNDDARHELGWWFITFEDLASFASWQPLGGGKTMTGGSSTVIKIPKAEFRPLNAAALQNL